MTERIGLQPEYVLFFDDHEANVAGARMSGWRAELFQIGDPLIARLNANGLDLPVVL